MAPATSIFIVKMLKRVADYSDAPYARPEQSDRMSQHASLVAAVPPKIGGSVKAPNSSQEELKIYQTSPVLDTLPFSPVSGWTEPWPAPWALRSWPEAVSAVNT
jgi:hypothetical protein